MQDRTRSSSIEKSEIPGFAPTDPTDNRDPLDWRSRYKEPEAQQGIRFDAMYLAVILVSVPLLIVVLWLEYPKYLLKLSDEKYQSILKYGLAWLSGMLGGTLFDIKWLYHSVARQSWHLDRRLWRVFTPHISGGLAFAIIALVSSGVFRVFSPQATESCSMVVGMSFITGYFSDSAIAKLTEIAETLFGASRAREKHKERSNPSVDSTGNSNKTD